MLDDNGKPIPIARLKRPDPPTVDEEALVIRELGRQYGAQVVAPMQEQIRQANIAAIVEGVAAGIRLVRIETPEDGLRQEVPASPIRETRRYTMTAGESARRSAGAHALNGRRRGKSKRQFEEVLDLALIAMGHPAPGGGPWLLPKMIDDLQATVFTGWRSEEIGAPPLVTVGRWLREMCTAGLLRH